MKLLSVCYKAIVIIHTTNLRRNIFRIDPRGGANEKRGHTKKTMLPTSLKKKEVQLSWWKSNNINKSKERNRNQRYYSNKMRRDICLLRMNSFRPSTEIHQAQINYRYVKHAMAIAQRNSQDEIITFIISKKRRNK